MTRLIEIRHLQTFLALSETGNLSKAARRVHLSQPAVSHQLKGLEEECGVQLFERKTSPLRLTPAGQRLLTLAYEVDRSIREAQRDLARIAQGNAGRLRIAVECHSCFDWLMPSMDAFREGWPEVELDLVSGFHADPIGLLSEDRAELVIVSQASKRNGVTFYPLFRYEVLALVAKSHPLAHKDYLTARDFAGETLITYPIPDERLDLVRDVLLPAKVNPARRTTELTVAILQLVASRRGIAALPGWTVQPYLERDYVAARRVGKNGLFSKLYAAISEKLNPLAYMNEFISLTRQICEERLKFVSPISSRGESLVGSSSARRR